MATRKILTYPDPILRRETEKVTVFDDKLRQLAADLIETMYAAPGSGLAANQIGVSLRVVVVDTSPPIDDAEIRERSHLVLVNPEIIEGDGAETYEEGCLSITGYSAKVKRYTRIKVRAQNLAGKTREFEAMDHFARIIQHEVDHLNCILFIDRISSLKRALYKKRLKKQLKDQEQD